MEYSLTLMLLATLGKLYCLNPCSNGILSDIFRSNLNGGNDAS